MKGGRGHRLGATARSDGAPGRPPARRRGIRRADVAARSDVIITMVTDTRAVEDVVLGEHGIARGAQPGSLVIDHSTIAPDGARRIAATLRARGVEMLDAPVSGGSAAAEAGTLAIMVGGRRPAFERASPVLSCYAKTIVHIGPSGAGQVAKACNQICTIVNQLGAAEAMLLAERAGVDPRAVKEALMGGFAASRMLDLQAPKMIARDFEGKVESRLHHKDIHIVLDLARRSASSCRRAPRRRLSSTGCSSAAAHARTRRRSSTCWIRRRARTTMSGSRRTRHRSTKSRCSLTGFQG